MLPSSAYRTTPKRNVKTVKNHVIGPAPPPLNNTSFSTCPHALILVRAAITLLGSYYESCSELINSETLSDLSVVMWQSPRESPDQWTTQLPPTPPGRYSESSCWQTAVPPFTEQPRGCHKESCLVSPSFNKDSHPFPVGLLGNAQWESSLK